MRRTLASFKLTAHTKEALGLIATKLGLHSNTYALEVAVEMLFNAVYMNKTARRTVTVDELEREAIRRTVELRSPF